ncbi:MAG: 4-hydroxythreonine-4-phosphate dehydrogenase PdxA [Melioribacteraceae bacterium]|nr:4-hydroxythreonine-4-phosphate dehydrogenase PdxA [Melioribacteraceae bacterium]
MNRLIFTSGDINGIGPEIVLKAINNLYSPQSRNISIAIPKNVFDYYSNLIVPSFPYEIISPKDKISDSEKVKIIDIGDYNIDCGIPTAKSGLASYNSLKIAFEKTYSGQADILVTAPIAKVALKMGGVGFSGHTELLAEWCGVKNFMMMFLSEELICALMTIHIPIRKVSNLLTEKKLISKLRLINYELKNHFGITNPSIAVLGLNPHAGEDGNIGKEEIEKTIPAIKKSMLTGIDGPFPSDSFFGMHDYKKYDAVLGMYHDQVLIPFKMMNMSNGVNYTAGLPIIRTSPDHGTAFNIANKGIADPTSIINAAIWGEKIAGKKLNEKSSL